MRFPTPHTVTRIRPGRRGIDELGNDVYIDVIDQVKVAGWALPQSTEPKLAGHDRLVVVFEMYARPGDFQATDKVRLPGRTEDLQVVGESEDFEHGPFGFAPGLVVVNLTALI